MRRRLSVDPLHNWLRALGSQLPTENGPTCEPHTYSSRPPLLLRALDRLMLTPLVMGPVSLLVMSLPVLLLVLALRAWLHR